MLLLADFIKEYFFDPIMNYSGFNIVNTAVYALILIFAAFYLIYPFFNKRGIKFGPEFFKAVFPFILFGSSFRVIEDMKLFARSANPLDLGYYFVTPGVYLFIGVFTIIALIAAIYAGKKLNKKPLTVFSLIGWLAAIPFLAFALLSLRNFFGIGLILISIFTCFFLVKFVFKHLSRDFFKQGMHDYAFLGQLADGSATFIAIQFFNYGEQHVMSNFLIISFGPISFLLAKIALVLVVIYAVEAFLKKEEESNLKNFILLCIAILGFAPGLRDLLRLGILT